MQKKKKLKNAKSEQTYKILKTNYNLKKKSNESMKFKT